MKLVVSRLAGHQIDRLLMTIHSGALLGASRVRARLTAMLDLLTVHPAAGRLTDKPHVRRLVIAPYPYLVFYRVDDDAVVVLAVRHAARNLL